MARQLRLHTPDLTITPSMSLSLPPGRADACSGPLSNTDTPSGAATGEKPRRIYIDCTSTYLTGLNTGIQRVVRGLVGREHLLTNAINVPCLPVIALQGRYWPFSQAEQAVMHTVLQNTGSARKSGRDLFVRFEQNIRTFARRLHLPEPMVNVGLTAARRLATLLFWRIQASPPLRALRQHKVRPIAAQPGDLLFIPDAFWGEHGQLPAIEQFARRGGAVVPVIHDVAPLSHPDYFPAPNVRAFHEGLTRILAVTCGILAVSRATMADAATYCAALGYDHLPMDYAYSGADLAPPSSVADTVRPEIAARCAERPFLMVGTIEPRKGYKTALTAYEQYQRSGGRRPLVIAGRLGWKEGDIVAQLRAVAASTQMVFSYHEATDSELAALYAHAGALIFASFYEGFGLPLVEAMHLGLPVIASDIPVFREIGQDYPTYFQVGDATDLCRALQAHDEALWARKAPRAWPTWDEAAPAYLEKAISLYANRRLGGVGRLQR